MTAKTRPDEPTARGGRAREASRPRAFSPTARTKALSSPPVSHGKALADNLMTPSLPSGLMHHRTC